MRRAKMASAFMPEVVDMSWLGLDIGGANIKVADGVGFAATYPFALWKARDQLAQELRRIIAESSAADHLVATMTGELADCFETKEEGVHFIVDSLEHAADGRHTRIYLSDGSLVAPVVARRRFREAAAANWHALATYGARFMELGFGLLIDIGSTTCDVIPISSGRPIHRATADTERLICGELVYTGVERSPVCAIVQSVPYRAHRCPVAQEVFATTRDVYVVLDELGEDSADTLTADGRPATKRFARIRLARAICADTDSFHHKDAVQAARAIADAQAELLAAAIRRVIEHHDQVPQSVLVSGHGDFLARRALARSGVDVEAVYLRQQLGAAVSRAATAHAAAVLAEEAAGR